MAEIIRLVRKDAPWLFAEFPAIEYDIVIYNDEAERIEPKDSQRSES